MLDSVFKQRNLSAHNKPATQKGNFGDFPLGSWLLGLHAEKGKRRHLTKQLDGQTGRRRRDSVEEVGTGEFVHYVLAM